MSCVAVGAAASAIATAGAATSPSQAVPAAAHGRRAARGVLARAVHGDLVIATKKRGFVNVTFDRGVVQSVQGRQLTVVEGGNTGARRTVAITVPANAIVRDNGRRATLADVKPGQRVRVVHGLAHTRVSARNA